MRKKILFFLTLFWISSGVAIAGDDAQYWSRYSVTPISTEKFTYTSFWEMRLREDVSDLSLWYTSQRFKVHPLDYLSLGLNYTYLQFEVSLPKGREDEWKFQHRLELEINPKWKFENKLLLKNRNRVEFRWIEDNGSDHGRFRQMWGLSYPLEKVKGIQSIYANNEYFVDFNRRSLNENRVVPVGLKFKVHDHVSFQLFYMIQSQKAKGSWRSNQIFGTQVNLSL